MTSSHARPRIIFALFLLFTAFGCNQQKEEYERGFRTVWTVKPSLKFEACNLIGILLGREVELRYHAQTYREWQAGLPGSVKTALVAIDQIIGPDWPPGPRLSLLLSNLVAPDSLAPLLAAVQNDEAVRAGLLASDYASERNWEQWLRLKPHLEVALQYLISANFESYWRSRTLPELSARAATLKQELQAYDVVGDVERFLRDYDSSSDTVTIYLLALAQPHELRLARQSRYSGARLPVRPLVKNFYAEMLHPYCDRLVDSTFAPEFSALQSDAFVQEGWRKLLAEAGPSSFAEFMKKEVVLAATLWLAERRRLVAAAGEGQSYDQGAVIREYLRRADRGGHALAAVLYSYLESGLKIERVSYRAFIKDLFATGRLQPGKIAPRYGEFMNAGNGATN
jgi:hypothetical protein